jgi:hypothetical protein
MDIVYLIFLVVLVAATAFFAVMCDRLDERARKPLPKPESSS